MPRRSVRLLLLPCAVLLLVATFVLSGMTELQAQQADTSPALSRPGFPRNGTDEDGPFRDNPELRERWQRGRAADRQRRIVDDADRLIALTAQYRTAVAAHGTSTEDDQKLLAQIEKLARDVKDRMRGM